MARNYPSVNESLTFGELLSGFDRQILWLMERGYLDHLVIESDTFAAETVGSDFLNSFQGFQLSRFHSYSDRDRDLASQNIENWLGLFRDGSHSFLMNIDGHGQKVPEIAFIAGKRKDSSALSGKAFTQFLRHGLAANFPGSERTILNEGSFSSLASNICSLPHAGVITGIPSRKKNEEKFFAQGIERFLDSVTGLKFNVLLVAEPYSGSEINGFINPVLDLKNAIGQFRKFTLSDTKSIADSLADTLSANVFGSSGTTHTDGTSTSHADANLEGAGAAGTIGGVAGTAAGFIGGALGCFTGPLAPIAVPLLAAAGTAIGTLGASLLGGKLTSSDTITKTISDAISKTGGISLGYARTWTKTLMTSQSIGREAVNYSAEYALELLDFHIERLRAARNYGYWNAAIYVTAEDPESFLAVRNAAIACFSGEGTHLEPLRFVLLKGPGIEAGGDRALTHAVAGHNSRLSMFDAINQALQQEQHPLGAHMQGIGTPLTTAELGIFCAPPQRECRAVSVTERAVFGGKTMDVQSRQDARRLDLGKILYFGEPTTESVSVPLDGLCRHVLVTGITGSGKTNTVQGICRKLDDHAVPWLVIEPGSKSEYRNLGASQQPHVFRLGSSFPDGPAVPFRFNPFYFPRGVEVLPHIDRVKAAFNAAFPMYASMPYLLEEAIVRCYEEAGWDLNSSTNFKASNPADPWSDASHRLLFPTIGELPPKIDEVVAAKRYDVRLEMDLSAALRARIGSLLLGAKGSMLNTRNSLDLPSLLNHRVVLEMAAMGSDEEKVLMMGFLVGGLFEAAQVAGLSADGNLRHVLVIEEAHRLLRAAPPGDNPEIANVRGAAVEQFANLLSELRAFGHGVAIVDQSPSRLLPDVVRSTHFKIVHQLAAEEDRFAVGAAMALDAAQTRDLARLRRDRGEAVVFQPEWPQAYCISVPKNKADTSVHSEDAERQAVTRSAFPATVESSTGTSLPVAAYRAVCGMILADDTLLESGIKSKLSPADRLDIAAGIRAADSAKQDSSLHRLFEDLLSALLRVAPPGLDVLGDMPEQLGKALAMESEEKRKCLIQLGEQLRGCVSDSNLLLGTLVGLYANSQRFGIIPAKIARETPPGDACCRKLRDFTRQQTDELLKGAQIQDRHRLLVERLIVEQAVRLSGMGRPAEVVERCLNLP